MSERLLGLSCFRMAQVWSIWKTSYRPFKYAGSQTFVLATPNGNILWSSDPSVLNQLLVQHDKCQTPLHLARLFDIWGPSLGSTEGEEWKLHRKVISAGFNSSINTKVWKESIDQTGSLLENLAEQGSVVPNLQKWSSRLALHVISSSCFGRRLHWQDYETSQKQPPIGHTLKYEEALFTFLDLLGFIFMIPRPLLKSVPLRYFRDAYTAFVEWTQYMDELREGVIARLDEVRARRDKSILGSDPENFYLPHYKLNQCRINSRCRSPRARRTA